jgi:trigger factor
MNVVRENRENQTALIKVTVGEADYMEAVDRKLKEYRRKANVPGFRPGMVPMGIINKMYRKGTVAETAYKTASDAAFEYIDKEKIDYMGDVLPSDEQGSFDFDNNTEFEFVFEIGLAPEVALELSENDKLTRYKIKITDDMRQGFRTNFMRRYGHLADVDTVTSDEAVTGTIDNGEIRTEDAYVGLISMSEEERKPYIGRKVGDELTVNVEELYKTPSQRASVLGVKENELAGIAPEFKFTITRIRKFAEPELNEEFFKTAFPEGNVADAAQLDKYIDSQIEAELDREAGYVFNTEVRNYLVDKANLTLPDDFLKRWLFTVNEGRFSMEDIEKDFPAFLNMMRWNLIQKNLSEKLGVKVEQEDMLAEAKAYAAQQFAQYGMMNVGDEVLANYAQSILGNKEEANKILDRLYEKKIIDAVTPLVKVSSKSVTAEELNKVFDKLNARR